MGYGQWLVFMVQGLGVMGQVYDLVLGFRVQG